MSEIRLVVNADDFGQSPEINEGVLKAFEGGIVTSTSLMVRWPAARQAAEAARARPELDLGLHIDLAEFEFEGGEWRPRYSVVDLSDHAAVHREACRQLDEFRRLTATDPTHLDSHQHLHRRSPLRDIMLEMAESLSVPLRHLAGGVRYLGSFYGQPEPGRSDPKAVSAQALVGILEGLPVGVTELCCHPALGNTPGTMYSAERNWEVEALCSPQVRRFIDQGAIRLCSFRDLSSDSNRGD